jgi:amino acid adenylation domain-containing protein
MVRTSVDELIHDQVKVRPDAVAVFEGDKRITYRELDQRAHELALRLQDSGVHEEVPVGLCVRRSADFVIGALGILKAGGAYVPLDPSYPKNRLAMLLQDSQVGLVVTHPSVVTQLPQGSWHAIVMDGCAQNRDAGSAIAPLRNGNAANLAYIIFTSGSTGRPKGVQITHLNLLNLIGWHQRAFAVTANDKATMHASSGFDAAVWEIWPYLAAGASVAVVDENIRTSPEGLRDWILANRITISFLPTALTEAIIDLPWPAQTALRFLLTGADTLRRYPRIGLPFALVNNYGPTECTVVTTSGIVSSEQRSAAALPPIGRPIDNVQVHLVDEQLQPVPDGTPGELVIGGASVGRGYLNSPDLTDQKFIADRFGNSQEGRLYRTGDLARRLPDGQLAFLGRVDEQVKVRGYRIEPGEITAVLEQHSAVQSSFVTACSDDSGETRLIAYVVPVANERLSADELRRFLADHLPEFMVPSVFVSIAGLPFTAHGKVDRAALPSPTSENILHDGSSETPQSEIEQWLASLLATLLRTARVSRDDNFFNLGGHSLMGAQLIAKVKQTFDVDLPLRSLFDHPTIREISSEIDSLLQAKLNSMSEEEARRLLETSPAESSL